MDDPQEDEDIVAAITYSVHKNSDEVLIDVVLSDYDSVTADALCKILQIIAQDSCVVQTIGMVKEGLIAAQQEEMLLEILTKVGQNIAKSNKKNEEVKDKPCISPSDML